MKSIRRRLAFTVCLTLSALCCQSVTYATTNISDSTTSTTSSPILSADVYYDDYSIDYYLSKNPDNTSNLRVVETITAVFPETNLKHGIIRSIPYTNAGGVNLTVADEAALKLRVKRNGVSEIPMKVNRTDAEYLVYLGDADTYLHGTQIYELEYEFNNIIMTFQADNNSWQELYWDTNGNDTNLPLRTLTAHVHLADDIRDSFTGETSCYIGSYGVNNQSRCQTTLTSNGVEFRTSDLTAHETLTFDLSFNPNTFVVPGAKYQYYLLEIFLVMVVFGFFIIHKVRFYYRQVADKRNFYRHYFVKPEYTPPRNFYVADMATNYVKSVDHTSIRVATLIELAVTHKINIIKSVTQSTVLKQLLTTWTVEILSLDLSEAQTYILKILAGKNQPLNAGQRIDVTTHAATTELVSMNSSFTTATKNRLYQTKLLESRTTTNSESNAKTTCRPPRNPANSLFIFGILWMIISSFAIAIIIDDIRPAYIIEFGITWLTPLVITLFLVVAFFAFTTPSKLRPYYRHTKKGLEYSRYLDGLYEYIKLAEADRLRLLQSVEGADVSHTGVVKLYEKLLPYAIIFHLENSWITELNTYYSYSDTTNPSWLIGTDSLPSTELIAFCTAANRRIYHSTTPGIDPSSRSSSDFRTGHGSSSSSFSGSHGGGFAGGGGGGGGSTSW